MNWLKLRNCRREKIEAGGSGTRRLYSNRGERVNEWGPQDVASQRKEAMAKPVPASLGTSLASFFFFSIGFPRSIIRRSFVTSVLHLPPAAVYTPGSSSPHNRSFVVRFHSDDRGQYRIPSSSSSSSSSPSCHPSSPRRSFVVKFHSDGGQYLSLALSFVCVDLPILCTWDSAIVIFSQNFHRQFLWRILDLWSELSSVELHMRSICLWEKLITLWNNNMLESSRHALKKKRHLELFLLRLSLASCMQYYAYYTHVSIDTTTKSALWRYNLFPRHSNSSITQEVSLVDFEFTYNNSSSSIPNLHSLAHGCGIL